MSELFILQNQDYLFLGKHNTWVDGQDPGALFKTAHKDEAINQMVETSAKDHTQRIKVIGCSANEKGLPIIDSSIAPKHSPKPATELTEEPSAADAEPLPISSYTTEPTT